MYQKTKSVFVSLKKFGNHTVLADANVLHQLLNLQQVDYSPELLV